MIAAAISVKFGARTLALPEFVLTVLKARKENYGHYFATHYSGTPDEAATLCELPGVTGVVWHAGTRVGSERRTSRPLQQTASPYARVPAWRQLNM